MIDKPEIKVGQRWVTPSGRVVRVLAVDGKQRNFPIVAEDNGGGIALLKADGTSALPDGNEWNFVSLAPYTVKREVALYREGGYVDARDQGVHFDSARRISEPVSVEFTLLPGESAE